MSHRWAALVLVLALCAMTPRHAAGQTSSTPRGHKLSGKLKQNYPNPFNPETTIPFSVEGCLDGSEQGTVSVRILNILGQLVAIPVFAGTDAASTVSVSSSLLKQKMSNLRLPCGSFKSFWDGNNQANGKEAASGIYVYQLFVDGKLAETHKMAVVK